MLPFSDILLIGIDQNYTGRQIFKDGWTSYLVWSISMFSISMWLGAHIHRGYQYSEPKHIEGFQPIKNHGAEKYFFEIIFN